MIKALPGPAENRLNLLKAAAICLSASNLLFLNTWSEIYPGSEDQYVKGITISPMTLIALWTNILIIAGFLFLFYKSLHKSKSFNSLTIIASFLFLAILFLPCYRILVQYYHFLHPINLRKAISRSGIIVLAATLPVLIISVAVWKSQRFLLFIRGILLVLSPAPFILSIPILRTISKYENTRVVVDPVVDHAHTRHPRVVVLIFDEWDYEYTFSERPPRIQLPEIDRFCRQYGNYTSCWPPSGQTIRSIPSLATGKHWLGAVPGQAGELLLKDPETNRWKQWSDIDDLFVYTAGLGWKTQMIQWLHQIPASYVQKRPGLTVHHHPDSPEWDEAQKAYRTYRGSVVRGWRQLILSFQAFYRIAHQKNPIPDRVSMVNSMTRELLTAVRSKNDDLIWAHLPFPHLPGIIDSKTGAFLDHPNSAASNLDNMLLVDQTLHALRVQMESQGDWEQSLIVLTADHWQRENATENIPSNPGKYARDQGYRVPLLVKWPYQSKPWIHDEPVSNTSIRGMIEAVAKGQNPGESFRVSTPPPNLREFLLTNHTR